MLMFWYLVVLKQTNNWVLISLALDQFGVNVEEERVWKWSEWRMDVKMKFNKAKIKFTNMKSKFTNMKMQCTNLR